MRQKHLRTLFFVMFLLSGGLRRTCAQGDPSTPDNAITSNDKVGLPPTASRVGTSEEVNLHNGSLHSFIPMLSLPQRAGAKPLELGLLYDSTQEVYRESVNVAAGTDVPDSQYYQQYLITGSLVSSTYSGTPFEINLPRLQASIEYVGHSFTPQTVDNGMGEWLWENFCLQNFTFMDWSGAVHVFQLAKANCTNESSQTAGSPVGTQQDYADNFRLDASNLNDFVVTGPDGEAYHFANPSVPCPDSKNTYCDWSASVENWLTQNFTSIVDVHGNTLTLQSNGVLIDTLGRQISVGASGISWKDANGIQQSVTLASETAPTPDTATDPGPASVACYANVNTAGDPPNDQYSYYLNSVGSNSSTATRTAYSLTRTDSQATFHFVFDGFGHLIRVRYPSGGYSRYDYTTIQVSQAHWLSTCDWPQVLVAHQYQCANTNGVCGNGSAAESVTAYDWEPSNGANAKVTRADGGWTFHWLGSMWDNLASELASQSFDSGGQLYAASNVTVPIVANGTLQTQYTRTSTSTVYDPQGHSLSQTTVEGFTLPYALYDGPLPQRTSSVVYGYDGSTLTSSTYTYKNDLAKNLIGLPQVTVTADPSTGLSRTVDIEYDSLGVATSKTLSGSDTGIYSTVVQQQDSYGRPTVVADPKGNVARFTFGEDWAFDTQCPQPSGAYLTQSSNALNQTTTYKYYSCTGAVASVTDPNGTETDYTYDGQGRHLSTTKAGQVLTTSDYHSDTVPLSVTVYRMQTPNPTVVTTTTSDGLARAVRTSVDSAPGGPILQDMVYDLLGRTIAVSNPYQSTADPTYGFTSTAYDGQGRMKYKCFSATQGDGVSCPPGAQYTEIDYSLDGGSQLLRQDLYDEARVHRADEYDAAGNTRLVYEITQGATAATVYTYDGFKDLLSVNQVGIAGETPRLRNFHYDALSRLITAQNPESGIVCYGLWSGTTAGSGTCQGGYDANGNLLYTSEANGAVVGYTYDPLNRLATKGANDGIEDTHYTYTYDQGPNGIGRLTSVVNAGWTEAGFTYDVMGRVTQTSWSNPGEPVNSGLTNVLYDVAGNRTQITYPDGRLVSQTYDSAGQLSGVYDGPLNSGGAAYFSNAQYWPAGELKSATYSNGVSETITLNSRLQPCHTAAVLAPPGGAAAIRLYDRSVYYQNYNQYGQLEANCQTAASDNGNIYAIVDNVTTGWSQGFNYDALNRLSSASRSDGGYGRSYGYDSFGNMMPVDTSANNPVDYRIDSATNRLYRFANNAPVYSYDAAGRLMSTDTSLSASGAVSAIGGHNFTYTAEGFIRGVDNYATGSYLYDGLGNRTFAAGNNGLFKQYVYLNGQVMADVDPYGVWEDYIYANGQKIARLAGTSPQTSTLDYYLDDHLNTTQMELDSIGNVIWRGQFTPFGEELDASSGTTMRYKFTGKERDQESGLDYFGARYFASSMGRFTSPDWSAKAAPVPYAKLENPQSLNLYAYVQNDPVGAIDADGHAIVKNQWGDDQLDNPSGATTFATPGQAAEWALDHGESIWELLASGATIQQQTGAAQQQNQSSTTTTTSQGTDYVSISYWPKGAGGFGHIGIGVDTDNTQGYSTADPKVPWYKRIFGAPAGATEFDLPAHTKNGEVAPHSYMHIAISADQAAEMRSAMAAGNGGHYNLIFNNCAQFVESVLHAGGVSGIPHGEVFGPAILGAAIWYGNTWR